MSSSVVPWPHEAFARKRLLAATLSARAHAPTPATDEGGNDGAANGGSERQDSLANLLFDAHVNVTLLARNTHFVRRVLEAVMFDLAPTEVCDSLLFVISFLFISFFGVCLLL
jgi:hypothetical protein